MRIPKGAAEWLPPLAYPTPTYLQDTQYIRNTSFEFQEYSVGIGGTCLIYTPPVSYWCSQYPSGGGATFV